MTRVGITALIPTFAEDVVAIFKDDDPSKQILTDANLISASVDEDATFFRHPLENGRRIVDHRILNPVTIDIRIILTDSVSLINAVTNGPLTKTLASVYKEIQQLFRDAVPLSIQTRTDTYPRQLIQGMPHEETSQMFDGIALRFKTSELQLERAEAGFNPEDDTKSDTAGRGKQNSEDVSPSTGAKVLSQATSIFGG